MQLPSFSLWPKCFQNSNIWFKIRQRDLFGDFLGLASSVSLFERGWGGEELWWCLWLMHSTPVHATSHVSRSLSQSNPNWLRLTFVGYQRFMAKVASCKLKIFNKVCRLRNIAQLFLWYISQIKITHDICKQQILHGFNFSSKNVKCSTKMYNLSTQLYKILSICNFSRWPGETRVLLIIQ